MIFRINSIPYPYMRRKNKADYLSRIQRGLNPRDRLYQIVEHGMCIGCGICQSIAGPETVQMTLVENGTERPLVVGDLDHQTVDRITRVCPGTRVEGLPENLVDEDSQYHEVWGIWRQIVLAYAATPDIRHLGSTGGLLTALALYLLESGEVDFVVHATSSNVSPTFGERFISRNKQDVLEAAGSRYGPTATLIDIVEILDQCEQARETFAFIGTPCDVSALRNYAAMDARVNQLCRFQMVMVCGGFMSPAGMGEYLAGLGIEMENIKNFRYRGYGCPGSTRIEMDDGQVIEKNYLDFWGQDESAWKLPFRCKVCPDGIGDAADIAASDTWDGGSPTREGQLEDPGTNAVIVRSRAGEDLLHRAVSSGYVCLGDSLTPMDMDRFQPHQVTKKRSVWARFVGMRNAAHVVPDVRGLRLKPLARGNSLAENLNQARGSLRRARDGKNNENTPIPAVKSVDPGGRGQN